MNPVSDETGAAATLPPWSGWLTGRAGWWAALGWGGAEGTLFFIMPDVILTATALFSFRAACRQTFAVLIGALVAGMLMFTWAARDHARAEAAVLGVPFVRAKMAETVRADYSAHGAVAPLLGPTSGIPYKLYAIEAPGRVGLPVFLLASIPARLERLAITLALFGVAGWVWRKQIAMHPRWALAGHAAYWVAVYAYYWSVI